MVVSAGALDFANLKAKPICGVGGENESDGAIRFFPWEATGQSHPGIDAARGGAAMTTANPANGRREVRWNLVLQYSGVALMLLQGVLLVPLYLKFVGSAEFGFWLVASGVATWIAIVDPGVSTLMQQRISQALGGARPARAVRLARRGLRLSVALAVVVVVIGASGSGWLLRMIDPEAQMAKATGWWLLFLSVVGVALGLLASYATAVGVALRDARPHTLISVVSAVAGIAATVGLLWNGWGVLALPAGIVGRGVLQAVLSFRLVSIELGRLSAQQGDVVDDDHEAEKDGRSLAWLALDKLTGTLVVSADLFVIGRYFDGGMVTSYALTKRPVDLLLSLLQRPTVALSPTLSYLAGSEKPGRLGAVVEQASGRLFWLIGGAALGTFLLLQPLVSLWVGPAHYLGGHAAGILAWALAANAFSGLFANLYWATGATVNFCKINSVLSVLGVLGILSGLHFFGVTGLLIGALLPRLLLATWLFPKLALRALNVDSRLRRAIWWNLAAVGGACVMGFASALVVRGAVAAAVWLPGIAGLVAYAVALGLFSGRFRQDMRSLLNGQASAISPI